VNKISECCGLFLRVLFSLVLLAGLSQPAALADPAAGEPGRLGLPDHVLPALSLATQLPVDSATLLNRSQAPLTLTVVLRRFDPVGFENYLRDVYDPQSTQYLKFLTPQQVSDRFGPSPQDYAAVQAYFERQGFKVAEGSANRITLTFSGTRNAAEQALSVRINDYKLGEKTFYANSSDPSLPMEMALRVEAVLGLSNLAVPTARPAEIKKWFIKAISCYLLANTFATTAGKQAGTKEYQDAFDKAKKYCDSRVDAGQDAAAPDHTKDDPPPPAWQGVDGTGQAVGIVAFDTFQLSDVADFIELMHLGANIANVSQVHINGGATPGPQQSEVVLDIDNIIALAQGAKIVVYDAPFAGPGTSFQTMFNAMINGGVSVISNSWTYCEDQTTLADVQSIDTILQTAAASGISAFSAAGDSGSTCWDGTANTTHVPTSSPHITAVGGSSLASGPGFTYGGETWWDGSTAEVPGGQGGFGVSRFFPRPAYQNGSAVSMNRSVPDVTFSADPNDGMEICQANDGGCPTGSLYGGTSSSTPAWAAFAALLNQAQGTNLGFLNPLIYAYANTDAFHSAASMSSDFAHVGLGSPNLARLHKHLTSQTAGPASASVSSINAFLPDNFFLPITLGVPLPVDADGTSQAFVVVRVADANGNTLDGKSVTLAANAGSHAVITPASGVSTVDNGTVIFTVTDLTAETVTFTATVTTDNVVIQNTANVGFIVPPAASGGITASPTTVASDGASTTTITVTLKDALNRPTPGKLINLSQGGGHSLITGPSPAVTDANGQIQFTATDNVAETVTYTAIDVTDGDLPVPGTAQVTFTGTGTSCVSASAVAAAGFVLTPFANGFASQNLFYSNVNWGCQGAYNPTSDTSGNVFVNDFVNGNLYKLSQSGGAVSNANVLSNIGLTLEQPVFGKDGNMYVARGATGSGFNSGVVLKIDPNTGAVLSTLASGLTCPSGLLVDPISGDLFFGDTCFGAGADNPSIWRISNPGSATPTLSVYAILPATPTVGDPGIAPDGTLYVAYGLPLATAAIARIAGTNTASPGSLTIIPGITTGTGVTVVEAQANGAAKSLLVTNGNNLVLVDITTSPFTSTVLATGSPIKPGNVGPDGCLYFSTPDTIFKLAPSSGACGFAPTNASPALALTPSTVSPDPPQGTMQTFTATFKNVSAPIGTPVFFTIDGANAALKLAHTDSSGAAAISYTGAFVGGDRIVATATVGSSFFTSNEARVTWVAGKHVTFLSLNASPTGGAAGQSVTLLASLLDISTSPPVPISAATIQFTLAGASCSGVTNTAGVAGCSVTLPAAGSLVLSATFAGNSQYVPAAASESFVVVAGTGPATVPGAPTIGTAIAGDSQITVSFTPPTSDGGSPITGYVVACTPIAGGTTVTATGTASPITVTGLTNGVAYSCTVSAINSVGTGPPSAASNVVTPIAQGHVTPVGTGLNNPRGLSFGPNGVLYVGEAGLGAGNGAGGVGAGIGRTGSVGEITGLWTANPTSFKRIVTGLASFADPGGVVGPDGVSTLGNGDIQIIMAESTPGVLADDPNADPAIAAQFGRLLRASQSGQWKVVADVGGFDYAFTDQNKDQPWAPAGQFPDANPYAVLSLPSRQYVVDAGANTVDEVRGNGLVRIIAYVPNPLFPATPGGPPVIPISDAVPTCVAQGADGFLYVGTLPFGATFARFSDPTNAQGHAFWAGLPPQAKVYRINPNRTDIFLTEADVWASGLDPITGCGFSNGAFYVTEFFTQASGFTSGAVVRLAINPDGSAGARTYLGVGALHEPNGFAAGVDGSIYVSNNSTSPGVAQTPGAPVGEVVRVDH